MVITEVLKEIGRGKEGARGMSASLSKAVFERVLQRELAPEALGAVLIAMRMKGETAEELIGALSAAQETLSLVPTHTGRPVVAIPSYNGARHMANLTPLLACLLADAGVQVIVHGVRSDPKRTTTAQIMQAMGLQLLGDVMDAPFSLDRNDPVFAPIDVLSPALADLLSMRSVLGVRNTGHTLVKMLDPSGRADCIRLVSYTHPEFEKLQHEVFAKLQAPAMIMRGTEGETVANAKRQARIDWMSAGHCETLVPADTTPLREVPLLPAAHDVMGTAQWIQSVLAGERAVPPLIEQQVRLILGKAGLVSASRSLPAGAPVLSGIRL